jgi:hypothetical protein
VEYWGGDRVRVAFVAGGIGCPLCWRLDACCLSAAPIAGAGRSELRSFTLLADSMMFVRARLDTVIAALGTRHRRPFAP